MADETECEAWPEPTMADERNWHREEIFADIAAECGRQGVEFVPMTPAIAVDDIVSLLYAPVMLRAIWVEIAAIAVAQIEALDRKASYG